MASKTTGGKVAPVPPAADGVPNTNMEKGAQGTGNAESAAPKGRFGGFMSGAKAKMSKAKPKLPQTGQEGVISEEKDTSMEAVNPAPIANGVNPTGEEEVEKNFSSADLDQLMMDFDLYDPSLESADAGETTAAEPESTTTEATTETKPAGLAGAISGGLGSLGLDIGDEGNAMLGKLGGLVTDNPGVDALSKGKSFLFEKFGTSAAPAATTTDTTNNSTTTSTTTDTTEAKPAGLAGKLSGGLDSLESAILNPFGKFGL